MRKMPLHRGIKLSIVSQMELEVHPEFPHPESSQFTYRSPDKHQGFLDWKSSTSTSIESKSDWLLGRQSIVSVYIPSAPGTRFWLRYRIEESAAEHSEYYFFRLVINGRNIVSWGINAKIAPDGQIMKGLFVPDVRSDFLHEGLETNVLPETRPFIFAGEKDNVSPANDGGLIEVLAFRARGRKRRLPAVAEFKEQDYGIAFPTGGVVETHKNCKFYDWHLKDPKDRPFAVFKFHYRSWDSLEELHLIPVNHRQTMLSQSSDKSLFDQYKDLQSNTEKASDSPVEESPSNGSILPDTPCVFEDSPQTTARPLNSTQFCIATPVENETSSCFSPTTADKPTFPVSPHIPRRSESLFISEFDTSPESPWRTYLDRPLPQIPISELCLKNYASRHHSRASSAISNAPSVTPSLVSYLDDNKQSVEPIEIGTASLLVIHNGSPTSSLRSHPFNHQDHEKELESIEKDYHNISDPFESPQSPAMKRRGMSSPPPCGLFSPSSSHCLIPELPSISPLSKNITIRKTRNGSPTKLCSEFVESTFSHVKLPSNSTDLDTPTRVANRPKPTLKEATNFKTQKCLSVFSSLPSTKTSKIPISTFSASTMSLSLSEGERMTQIPSPSRQNSSTREYKTGPYSLVLGNRCTEVNKENSKSTASGITVDQDARVEISCETRQREGNCGFRDLRVGNKDNEHLHNLCSASRGATDNLRGSGLPEKKTRCRAKKWAAFNANSESDGDASTTTEMEMNGNWI